MSELDQRYIRIAQACLAVLNNLNPAADRSRQIRAVHDAIDAAINDLYKQQERELERAFSALREISRLDLEQDDLASAVRIARDALSVRQ